MAKLIFKITDENINDILSIAMEGGINYWCDKAEVKDNDYKGAEYASDSVSKGASIIFHVSDDMADSNEVDKQKMKKAIQKYVNEFDSEIVDLDNKEIDCCMVDAEVADVIVQLACFGEVIFG